MAEKTLRATIAVVVLCVISMLAGAAWAGTQTVTVGTHRQMRATLIEPDGPGPFPAVLVLHTSGGLEHADIAFAERLSRHGYVCLVPEFLDAYGITPQTKDETFTNFASDIYDDFTVAIAKLHGLGKVAGSKVGAVGFSNGGYFAMWLAATGKIAAGVSYYGALSGAGTDIPLDRFRKVFNHASSPVLILHGTADGTVPVGAAKHLAHVLKHKGAPYELHLYEGADHRFDRDLGDDAAAKTVAEDAWRRTLGFLDAHLKRR